ncbi:YdeI family protein [Mucilaginibacter sp. L3T2-6]|uniref:YdeI/OmpD-associated family protein n=1 Tax=Mucilaginibacter sp. L3T2-6 TaxID=3062491 RepID=UPI002676A422|nr:YdeI/OmpD-associated family protein [Mucilaginibacter sp. L3T2-6]MDO3641574.1 YdeI/OmpD-associated family protein [Mucilaginibacter sp. L3T2-6]MDV6214068.1 YdeI/OmpD-associated family protein [Mucilaginibacter sp. L3T2-6]
MQQYDDRVDAYIDKAAPFAQPILKHIRQVIHGASPLITETMKWSMPFFEYKGPVAMMASFKQHLGFGFWKSSRLNDPNSYLKGGDDEAAAGSFGRIEKMEDLPPDEAIVDFIHQLIALNESGVKEPKKPATASKPELPMPDDFKGLLSANATAVGHFENFAPSKKREYLEWFADAKSEATRQKRMEQALEWISEGKSRNWKYQK